MKIAIIGPQGLPVPAVKGGAIETLIDVIIKENEKKNKLDIDIYTIFDNDAIEESKKYKNTRFIYLCKNKKYIKVRNKFISFLRKVLKFNVPYTYAQQIANSIKDINYDKIIVEGDSSLIGAISKVVSKDKIYLHIHHDPRTTNHQNFRNELLQCNKVIAVSNYIKEGLLFCTKDNKCNAEVLYNCTDTQTFNKEFYKSQVKENRKEYGILEQDIVIMFIGRPVPQKGVRELLLAFKELVKTHSNIKLLIVGNAGFGIDKKTAYDRELVDISSEIKDKVIFTGFIHNSRIPRIHAMSDIAVVPSIYDDPAPLVVIECLSSGLPLVVTNSGGVPEYINEKCAIVAKRGDDIVNNIKEALNKLIISNNLRIEMGQTSRIHGQQFSEDSFYDDFIKVLNN